MALGPGFIAFLYRSTARTRTRPRFVNAKGRPRHEFNEQTLYHTLGHLSDTLGVPYFIPAQHLAQRMFIAGTVYSSV